MRPRTRLTSPGGREPDTLARRSVDAEEVYSPGFAIPVDPGLPARWPWLAVLVTAALLLVALVYLLVSVVDVEEQDPSLGEIPSEVVDAGS